MANVLLNRSNSSNSMNSLIQGLKSNGPSGALFNQMYNSNPQFKQFADSVRGKSPEEAFSQAGLNFDDFKKYKW